MLLLHIAIQSLLLSSSLIIRALPLSQKQPAIQKRIAYSVVAVDGGLGGGSASTATPAGQSPALTTVVQTLDHVETVTASATTPPPTTETVVTTQTIEGPSQIVTTSIIETPPSSAESAIVVVNPEEVLVPVPITATTTQISTASPVSAPSTSTSLSTAIVLPSSTPITTSQTYSIASSETSTPTPGGVATSESAQPPLTASPVEPTTLTKTYDDGMWHTSYPPWTQTLPTLPTTRQSLVE